MRKLSALLMVCLGLILALTGALTVQAQNSGVNDAELNGNYAFTFSGFTGNSSASSVLAFVGRFTADGAGNVTNGEVDSNAVSGADVVTAQPFFGTYSIGSDHRGVMTLNVGGTLLHFAFAMMANGNAQFIEFDATGGSGIVGSGTMEKSDTTAYSTAKITGDYAFGLAGFDAASARAAFTGRFTANGAGALSNAAGDINAYGSPGPVTFTNPSYTASDTTHGRGTITMPFSFAGSPFTLHFVFYIVNSGKLLVMETDSVVGSTPLLSGAVLQQQTPAGGFSSASLNGSTVFSLTGRTACTAGGAAAPDVVVGLFTFNGSGGFTLSYDDYCGGANLNTYTGLSGTAAVATNGRVLITIGSLNEIAYLVSSNQFFFLATDSGAAFGFGDAQAAGAFTNASVSGNYAGFATTPATFGVSVFSGEFTADGASPTGHLSGAMDIGNASGPVSGQAFAATYAVSSSPTNGRATVTITSPVSQTALAYVISPLKFVVLPTGDPNPSVWFFEQAPASTTAVTLSSLTLSPTSVTGGTQSSTGTVTLSAPAPSAGAQVSLSSSNTAAARVPSSVTVAAGATTATFTVSTSAVTASTVVTISASYAGATKTASLTVNPAPPPPVTLSSLTLSPSSVVGGLQSSTGTVTLSGPAPAGGAQVSLFSSNSAASVPSSVFIPAGGTSVSFTVNTSVVLISTSADIVASYNNSTKSASLSILL